MSQSAFEALGLDARIVSTLTQNQLTTPTPVQEQTIPLLLQGRDLIGSAQTGTGKTAAFLLPALHRLAQSTENTKGRGARVLVLTPTRELAQQVARAAETFSKGLPRIKTVCVVGGVSYRIQNDLLAKPHEILVATPGRLIDHVNARRIDFSRLEMLILDEADRMLDMGFSDDVLAIANQLPKQRQTAFFTATTTHNVRSFANELLNDPATIEVAAQTARHEQIDQMMCYVDDLGHKKRLLKHFLAQEGIKQAIIFTATKRDTEELADELCVEGLRAAALHGDMPQRERTRTLTQLRRGEFDLLVATDVAARGIDVAGISHVFNFDLPRFAEDYVHRIGRTGRAGATGTAIALVGRDDVMPLRRIERFTSHKIRVHEVEGMEGRFRPNERKPGSGGGNGRPHGGGKRPGSSWGGKGKSHGDRGFGGDRSFGDRAVATTSGERSFGDRSERSHSHGEHPHADRAPANRGHFGDRHQDRGGYAGRHERSPRPAGAPHAAPHAPRAEGQARSEPRGEGRQPLDNSNHNPFANAGGRPPRHGQHSEPRSFSGDRRPASPGGDRRPGGQSADGQRRPVREGGHGARRDRYPAYRD
ncbi:hypothetical protein BXU06_04950 [Aquaspirillum sp. LM1]|uniref:DEAD/DEAH box helicase n=1 Tax=Aquaspirillum sp. LM1 TaxID=1938604 RepID=UPI000983C1F1|nr:DEAD/DEAH box helicase [Aquaspirillum sp. LM1]AQR64480.1 hypothetical protein BXU06_04950 [Aquaspirillum sp. LM1]